MREGNQRKSGRGGKKGNKSAEVKHEDEERGGSGMSVNIGDAIKKARAQLTELTGLPLSSTIKTEKSEGGWRVLIEMVEKRAIPDGMDVLATYEVILDENGSLMEFSRRGMRNRMDAAAEA